MKDLFFDKATGMHYLCGSKFQPMQIINHQYQIQNVAVLDIAQQFGTPLHVYDANKIVEKMDELKNAFPNVKLKIKFACKALTNVSIQTYAPKRG